MPGRRGGKASKLPWFASAGKLRRCRCFPGFGRVAVEVFKVGNGTAHLESLNPARRNAHHRRTRQ